MNMQVDHQLTKRLRAREERRRHLSRFAPYVPFVTLGFVLLFGVLGVVRG